MSPVKSATQETLPTSTPCVATNAPAQTPQDTLELIRQAPPHLQPSLVDECLRRCTSAYERCTPPMKRSASIVSLLMGTGMTPAGVADKLTSLCLALQRIKKYLPLPPHGGQAPPGHDGCTPIRILSSMLAIFSFTDHSDSPSLADDTLSRDIPNLIAWAARHPEKAALDINSMLATILVLSVDSDRPTTDQLTTLSTDLRNAGALHRALIEKDTASLTSLLCNKATLPLYLNSTMNLIAQTPYDVPMSVSTAGSAIINMFVNTVPEHVRQLLVAKETASAQPTAASDQMTTIANTLMHPGALPAILRRGDLGEAKSRIQMMVGEIIGILSMTRTGSSDCRTAMTILSNRLHHNDAHGTVSGSTSRHGMQPAALVPAAQSSESTQQVSIEGSIADATAHLEQVSSRTVRNDPSNASDIRLTRVDKRQRTMPH